MNIRYIEPIRFQYKGLNKSFALQDFSSQLENQLNQLKQKKLSLHNKKKHKKQKQQKQNNKDFSLPSLNVKSSQRNCINNQRNTNILGQNNKIINNKKWKEISLYHYHHKAKQIEQRINRIEQNNNNFQNLDKFSDEQQDIIDRNPRHIILAPPPPQLIPVPIYNFVPTNKMFGFNGDNNQMGQYYKINGVIHQRKKNNYNIPQSRKKYLKRRFKVILKAIYFIPLLKTYSKSIILKKCNRFLQVQQLISNSYGSIQWDIFKLLFNIDIFSNFYRITEDIQNQSQYQKQTVTILHEQQKINLNIKACHQFIKFLLKNIQKAINQGNLELFNPIFVSMLDGNFPLSFFFLKEQFKFLNLNPIYGFLDIPRQISKILFVNFIFVKITVYRMLQKRNQIVKFSRQTKKNKISQKLSTIYLKKLTITLVLLYETLNSIFLTQYKKSKSNYETLQKNLLIQQTKNQLLFKFQVFQENDKNTITNEKDLIKGIKCSQSLKTNFIDGFQQNWEILKRIIQDLYQRAQNFKIQIIKKIKEEVKNQKFINRKQLNSIVQYKYKKLKSLQSSSQNKELSKSVKKLNKKSVNF